MGWTREPLIPVTLMSVPRLRIYTGEEVSPQSKLRDVRARVEEKYAARIAKAGKLRGAFLRFCMRHELETELAKQANVIAATLGK